MTSEPIVRFDTAGGRSFSLAGVDSVHHAGRTEAVRDAIERAAEGAGTGLHAAGFVAYEAAPAFDEALTVHSGPSATPLAWFALFRERREEGAARGGGYSLGPWSPALDEAAFGRRVETVRELITAGDTYQVNLTFPLRAPFEGDPRGLYDDLLGSQRAGYAAFLDLGERCVISLSPELFFEWRGGTLRTRPMKGTRPRGRWPAEDDALAADLAASAKDRAENLMILDMLRNDLGRVAVPGSVRVPRRFDVERYPTVHQMTSTVEARPRAGTDLCALFAALFPCGSVTGAPKVRTMEIIRELEPEPRGVYCGAVGFVSGDEAVFNVPIRTIVVDRAGGEATMGVGSGIVYDSEPAAEYAECLAKAAFARPRRPPGLVETMRGEPGAGVALVERHLARMAWSAERLGLDFRRGAAAAAVRGAVEALGEPSMLRLVLHRNGTVEVERRPLPETPEPVRLAIAEEPVRSDDLHLYHKSLDRAPYDRRRAARPDVDDVVLINERGEVTEATRFNLVARLDGADVTPPVSAGLLPGVMRAELLDREEIVERTLSPDDLGRAEAIWVVNAVRGRCRAELCR